MLYMIVLISSCANKAKPIICSVVILLPFLLGERLRLCALSVAKAAPKYMVTGQPDKVKAIVLIGVSYA